MKANLRVQTRQALRQRLLRWSGKPWVEQMLRSIAAMAVGFVLAGFRAADTILPLPICLAAVLGLNASSFGAYVGGCLGYLIFYPFQAVEPMAAGLLVQAALCIFGDQLTDDDRWFCVGSAMAFVALVGFLFLLEQRFAAKMLWRYMLRVTVAGAGTLCFHMALHREQPFCKLILLACLCAGLCAIVPVGLPLGAVAACALSAACLHMPMALTAAALCGLALDLTWAPGCATAVLMLGALVGCCERRLLRLFFWLCAVLTGVLLTNTDPLLLAAAIFAAPCALLIPTTRLLGAQLPAVHDRDTRLGAASGLLRQLEQYLTPTRRDRPDPETATVFDRAAERVCRVCGGWDRCWNEQACSTVEDLEYAAPAMMTRGRALRSDLPPAFLERCCHVDGFLTAVNRELDDLGCRRQCRSRIEESRKILAEQYAVLADAFSRESGETERPCRYRPEVGFRCEEAPEQTVSGDRGATFRVGEKFYLILCDGMGTGSDAGSEAGDAIRLLRTLLQAGVTAENAMMMLNGIYILRDDGGFATVDLVRTDLVTGEALLLKWGAAPSYLKRKNSVEKLGTASPPPGVGVGEEYRPEEMKLSLARGELLVLLSDGAAGDAAERFLRQYGGSSPKELAFGVIHCQTNAEDDRSAAVLALRPRRPV
ncbi:MAG: SpoIIE family protein phosphatase [Oscillospiraceae bacterium]|nr:SpoIIE family protein phosphatase [Oscillospiraceae bacterium]